MFNSPWKFWLSLGLVFVSGKLQVLPPCCFILCKFIVMGTNYYKLKTISISSFVSWLRDLIILAKEEAYIAMYQSSSPGFCRHHCDIPGSLGVKSGCCFLIPFTWLNVCLQLMTAPEGILQGFKGQSMVRTDSPQWDPSIRIIFHRPWKFWLFIPRVSVWIR